MFHALGRYGVKEATLFDDIAPLLGEADLELLKKNAKAVFYEPLVGAAAHALATVCDRVRYGTIPEAVAADAMVQQAAALAANLAAQVHRWAEFRSTLRPHANGDVKALVLRALALGWSEKWRTGVAQLLAPLSPDAALLTVGVVADLALGDPVYAWHPVRLVGRMLTWMEGRLRAAGLDGYGGGVLLFVGLATVSLGVVVGDARRGERGVGGRWRGWSTRSFSTACWRSAICCTTCGGSRRRSAPAICRARAAP